MFSGIGAWVTMTPPNPVPQKSEVSGSANIKWIGSKAAYITKSFPVAVSFLESLSIVAAIFDIPVLKKISMLPMSTSSPQLLAKPPAFYIGALLIVFAGYIRCRCYQEMGRNFTFEVAFLNNHTLVTTGPYSIVRHPSYSATYFYTAGVILMWTSDGSWLDQGLLLKTFAGWIITCLWSIWWLMMIIMLTLRILKEDELLKKNFEKEWQEWRAVVPSRLFPGIY
ncbi:hypothetical protein D9758_016536 [Tetrapyrgos nigripes]|uniref:Protein-S-isoprenylcysteine O-methyltransferase n=1 Tax=Tetrapyrgos nigripes TaxID=182062 RepID=A0A8H5CB91_9AGAR|nr:hypothetical protein D9758_016536 [Tetrapyrgos nigripes]